MKIRIGLMLLALLGGCDNPPESQKGFAGLGGEAVAFAPVVPGRVFGFPADHGVHQGYRIEWWYVTANLKDAEGREFGVQWTLFRNALSGGSQADGWRNQTIWLGHAAVTSATVHHAAERYARGGVGQAGVRAVPFEAWIDDWQFTTQASGTDPLADMQLKARDPHFRYELRLTSTRPLVLQGDKGFSQKSEQGQASYYYSQPFFQTSGQLEIDGQRYTVSGPAWLDREWSSQPLTANQTGWDWFSLHLDSGEQVMLYRMRHKEGSPYLTGTWIDAQGKAQPLHAADIELVPLDTAQVAGRSMPVRWSIKIPGKQVEITTRALNPNAWMALRIPYWEGPVQVSGSHGGSGYLEMTGY
ncbi:lipocalin-like domain-containing protein [Pseudomonas corrugata]|uniref:lipocalin-like domain-containing protein n=1 Tax=Pseudomonas corrugata TaxID=47879 RepID=UPI0004642EE2|nr:lipocalin-like domain-containing protein [Pseudomonas corrugata]MDU9032704.1 lipocalin-like domain-containing protein [Pseudomonas corrugata]MDU9042179.1 lipocalin-like domain-containing protein [Pseudomonas corrugata]UZE04527.1 iron ABC transporter permease [Pseudomonas corrugata]